MNGIMILCLWLLSSPVGYVACRWVNQTFGLTKWTRMDRVSAVFFAMFYGPLMPVIAVVLVLIQKISESDWANRDARW